MTTELVTTNAPLVTIKPFDTSILTGQVRQSTISMYKRDFGAYVDFAGGIDAALNPAMLAQWRADLAKTDKSPNTINRMLASVRSLLKEASAQGYISSELAARFETVKGVKVSALRGNLKKDARTKISPEDMRRLCESPDVTTLAGKMHHTLLLTMASSGLRISEVVTLTPGQIEKRVQGKKVGYIVRVIGKTDTESREAPLSSEAWAAIQTWLVARPVASGYIFTGFGGRGSRTPQATHIHQVSAWEIVKRYAAKCELGSIKPHDFRRFVGTNLAKSDPRQAQKALGHKSIDTTYKHYVLDEMQVGLTENLF